ncbi:MAG: SRPBCC family protein [Methylocella sp.]
MRRFFIATIAAAAALPASAHGPTPQKVDETVTIAADPQTVWAVVGDFAGISNWDPFVTKSEGSNAKRVLTFQSGKTLTEEVDEYDPTKMTYTYRMLTPDLDALPVSSYSATLVVRPANGNQSEVEWYGRFYRGDTGNEPPDNLSDAAGREAMTNFFRTGLDGLKKKLEAK